MLQKIIVSFISIIFVCKLVAGSNKLDSGCEPFSDSMSKLASSSLTKEQPSIILSSPNYGPDRLYTPNATCARRIFAPRGYQIKLEFQNSTYDIETSLYSTCKYDMLEVRDGAYPYSPIMARFCSRTTNADSMLSRSNAIYLKFSSDASIEGGGFQIRITMLKITSQSISAVTNVCRHQLTGEDGSLSLRDPQFTKMALLQLEDMPPDGEDALVECNIDIEPAVDDVAYILIKMDFQSSDQTSQQFSTACPIHRFEFHDLGIVSFGKPAQQLPLDPESLQNVCTPSRDIIVVTKSSQATIRMTLRSSLLSSKQQSFYVSVEYAVLAPPERCLHLPPPPPPPSTKNANNKTANVTQQMRHQTLPTSNSSGRNNNNASNTSVNAIGNNPNRMGTWCSIIAITPDSINLLCLHPSLRCNGRNNCPTVSSVSVDESNCLALPEPNGMKLSPVEKTLPFPFNMSSEQVVKTLLYGSVCFVGLVLCTGLSILTFRKLALAIIKTRQKKKQYKSEPAEIIANNEKIINCRQNYTNNNDGDGCCGCCCESRSNSFKKETQRGAGSSNKKQFNNRIPPATAVRMTSAYRNQHSSPAFRCNPEKMVLMADSNNNNNNNNNVNNNQNGNRRFRKSENAEFIKRKQPSNSVKAVSNKGKQWNSHHQQRHQSFPMSSSSVMTLPSNRSGSPDELSTPLLMGSRQKQPTVNGGPRSMLKKKDESRYHSGSLFVETLANDKTMRRLDFADAVFNKQPIMAMNARLVKSSQNVLSPWLMKTPGEESTSPLSNCSNINNNNNSKPQNCTSINEEDDNTQQIFQPPSSPSAPDNNAVHQFATAASKIKPMLPVPPIVTTLRDVGKSSGSYYRTQPHRNHDTNELFAIRASPPTPFKNNAANGPSPTLLLNGSSMVDTYNNDDEPPPPATPVMVRLSDFAYQDFAKTLPPPVMMHSSASVLSSSYKNMVESNINYCPQQQDVYFNNNNNNMSTSAQYCHFSSHHHEQPWTSFQPPQRRPSSFHQLQTASSAYHYHQNSYVVDPRQAGAGYFSNGEDSNDSLMAPLSVVRPQNEFDYLDNAADLKCSNV